MSLVSVVASSKFISFVSDGREINTETNMIVSENFKKITKVNDKIIFSITGNSGASKIINSHLNEFCQDNARAFARSMFDQIGNGVLERIVMFLIGGFDENNTIYFTGFRNDSANLNEIIPTQDGINFGFSASDIAYERNAGDILNNCVITGTKGLKTFNPAASLKIQKRFNKIICEFDETVNTHIYHEYLLKK